MLSPRNPLHSRLMYKRRSGENVLHIHIKFCGLPQGQSSSSWFGFSAAALQLVAIQVRSPDGGVCPPVVGEAISNVDLKLVADGVHVAQAGCLHTVSQALLYLLETG